MKVIAMYLPQFHQVRENSKWWGEGFTEWTTVKAAEKLFPGHHQPKVPLNKNYYNLLERKTMKWQAELMHKYSVDGMCFYHYYFKDGRKILEKPAENLLNWKDVNMPFCFSWANESWVRSWSKISESDGNQWSSKFDGGKMIDESDDGVLLQQDYGDESDWIKHYKYLAKFFKDSRYIKYNNMPVFLIYKPLNIPCLKSMLKCWDELAKKDGFSGVYSIGSNISHMELVGVKGVNVQEPQDTINRFFPHKYNNDENIMKSLEYQEVWRCLNAKQVMPGESLGGFVGYDDTPRRGRGGIVIKNDNPYAFYEGTKKLFLRAKIINSPFVFFNAWNEWGEGMHLEPDEKYGNKFLEALKQAREDANLYKMMGHESSNDIVLNEENDSLKYTISKYRGYWHSFDNWMRKMESGWSPADYLKKQGYKTVAVYGYGMLGKHLIYQLQKNDFSVSYVIDQQREKKTDGVDLYTLGDNLPRVDVIIVTVLYDFNIIEKKLCRKTKSKILSLDMLFSE